MPLLQYESTDLSPLEALALRGRLMSQQLYGGDNLNLPTFSRPRSHAHSRSTGDLIESSYLEISLDRFRESGSLKHTPSDASNFSQQSRELSDMLSRLNVVDYSSSSDTMSTDDASVTSGNSHTLSGEVEATPSSSYETSRILNPSNITTNLPSPSSDASLASKFTIHHVFSSFSAPELPSPANKSNHKASRSVHNFSRPLYDQAAWSSDVKDENNALQTFLEPSNAITSKSGMLNKIDSYRKLQQSSTTTTNATHSKPEYRFVSSLSPKSPSADPGIRSVSASSTVPVSPSKFRFPTSSLFKPSHGRSKSVTLQQASTTTSISKSLLTVANMHLNSADSPVIPTDWLFNTDMTAEQHVSIGIKLHEDGNLNQSSYHLRKAAEGGNVCGMIFFGLALRHGWGIKINTFEAVHWFREAAKRLSNGRLGLHISDSIPGAAQNDDFLNGLNLTSESKTQLGLTMYELGISYLNAWGTSKDEMMALACFEVGAKLGDGDAMYEAGKLWCHNGPGRKKDMFKAAALYRSAADNGVTSIGNSWIYKEKYITKESKASPKPEEAEVHSHKKSFFSSSKKS
ncbi:hypothetical protein V1514DRAFT_48204 [Lipomyces japonicus]|uniref:uncharacterized protein n=1 Tax=Lipomyces japonicus TaxID=56871 RepID=UPI0034CEBE9D